MCSRELEKEEYKLKKRTEYSREQGTVVKGYRREQDKKENRIEYNSEYRRIQVTQENRIQ